MARKTLKNFPTVRLDVRAAKEYFEEKIRRQAEQDENQKK